MFAVFATRALEAIIPDVYAEISTWQCHAQWNFDVLRRQGQNKQPAAGGLSQACNHVGQPRRNSGIGGDVSFANCGGRRRHKGQCGDKVINAAEVSWSFGSLWANGAKGGNVARFSFWSREPQGSLVFMSRDACSFSGKS